MIKELIFSMNSKKRLASLPVTVAALALVSLGGLLIPTPAQAAPAQGNNAQFGIIDMNKIDAGSKPRREAFAQLQQLDQKRGAVLKRLSQGAARFLAAAEINELGLLYEKDKPTEADLKRITELEGKGEQVRRELTTLQNTPAPNETQSARLTALNEIVSQGDTALQALDTTLRNRLQEKLQESEKRVQTLERDTIAKVAKAKKLAVVFANDVAFYTTIDITEDVLKELSK
jgi:Skp family chaperone for outer membrane proteins